MLFKAFAAAGFAGQENIGHKLHFYLHFTLTLANIAAAAFHIKGEMPMVSIPLLWLPAERHKGCVSRPRLLHR